MQEAFDGWQQWRRYALPTQEERLLKRKLAESVVYRNRRAANVVEGSSDACRAATTPYPISAVCLPDGALQPLPVSLRRFVLDFCSAVEDEFIEDLRRLADVVSKDDLTVLNPHHQPPSAESAEIQRSPSMLREGAGAVSPRCAAHPLLDLLHTVDVVLQETYETRIVTELAAFAKCFGVSIGAHVVSDESSSSPGVGRRRSLVTYTDGAFVDSNPPAVKGPVRGDAAGYMSFHQRDVVLELVATIRGHLHSQRERIERALSWVRFREGMLHSTCSSLRLTVREDLCTWEEILVQWRMPYRRDAMSTSVKFSGAGGGPPDFVDMIFERALMELRRYQARVPSVEYLGRPDLSLDDVRNLFWEVGVQPPPFAPPPLLENGGMNGSPNNGVTEAYAQSITFRQAMTLGLTDIPWVRGYSWEDRAAAPDEYDDAVEEKHSTAGSGCTRSGGASFKIHQNPNECCDDQSDGPSASSAQRARSPVFGHSNPLSNRGGAHEESGTHSPNPKTRSICSVARSERVLQMLGNYGVDESVRRQLEELERERASMEDAEQAQRRKAFGVAAHAMSQRLWLSTDLFRPHADHMFAGCEICTDPHVAMVGLKRANSGASTDTVLCSPCFEELYSDESSVAHRMYQWHNIRGLVASGVTSLDEDGRVVGGGGVARVVGECATPPTLPLTAQL